MTVIMPFGKYKGESIENIIASDPAYHLWACNNNVHPLCEYPCTHVPSANKRKNIQLVNMVMTTVKFMNMGKTNE